MSFFFRILLTWFVITQFTVKRQNKKLEHEAPEDTQRVSVKCVEKFTIQCLPCRSEDSAKDNTDEYTGHPNGKVENEDIPYGLREEVQALAKVMS